MEGVGRMREAEAACKQISSGEKWKAAFHVTETYGGISGSWRVFMWQKPSASSLHRLQYSLYVCVGLSECVQKCGWEMKTASWPADVSPPSAPWIWAQVAALMSNLFLVLTNWLEMGHLSHRSQHTHLQLCACVCVFTMETESEMWLPQHSQLCSGKQAADLLSRVYFRCYRLRDWVALTLKGAGEERPARARGKVNWCRSNEVKIKKKNKMKWKAYQFKRQKRLHSTRPWVVVHVKWVKDNTVQMVNGFSTHGHFSVGCIHSTCMSYVACTERDGEGAEFLVVQEMGGRAYMDVSAAKSNVINVVDAWENTQHTLCIAQCVSMLHTIALLDFYCVDHHRCRRMDHFQKRRQLMNYSVSHWDASCCLLLFNGHTLMAHKIPIPMNYTDPILLCPSKLCLINI